MKRNILIILGAVGLISLPLAVLIPINTAPPIIAEILVGYVYGIIVPFIRANFRKSLSEEEKTPLNYYIICFIIMAGLMSLKYVIGDLTLINVSIENISYFASFGALAIGLIAGLSYMDCFFDKKVAKNED